MSRHPWIIGGGLALMIAVSITISRHDGGGAAPRHDYLRAVYSPLHFQPAIEQASDVECLACHAEILADSVRNTAATVPPAWYQQLSTYQGGQETFHRRHLATPFAKQVMALRCNTCHRGHDPRDEAPGTSATAPDQQHATFALRKQVDPETTCLKCHGQMPWRNMNLAGPWPEVRQANGNSCVANCHDRIRTNRHDVTYLKAQAIEAAGKDDADVCYGCHGGRAWYRIAYPYPRHAWPGMPPATPAWAAERPTESEARFRTATAARTFKP